MVIQVNDYRVESEAQIQHYLDKSDLRLYSLTKAQFTALTDVTKANVSTHYTDVLNDLNNIDQWMSLDPTNVTDLNGFFSLTKWALIGSDIYHNGLLAPIQFQYCGNRWDPHPGGDRTLMLLSMEEIWPVPVIIDVKNYFADYTPNYEYERIETVSQLKRIFKNWNESWTFMVPYDHTQSVNDHEAFMRVVIKDFLRAKHFAEQNNYTNLSEYAQPQMRFEIKNSKKLFRDIVENKQRMLDCLIVNKDSVTVGPWTLTQNGDLIWNSDQVWNL